MLGRTKLAAAAGAIALATIAFQAAPSTASGVRPGAAFSVTPVFGAGLLTGPVAAVTAPDGRIFVAQIGGIVKVFHGLSDTHPATFADLSNEVYSAQGHGLLGITLDPKFATNHFVYVLYSRDSSTPTGPLSTKKDTCPTHATTGCVRWGRLARLTANGDNMVASSEKALISDWCNQFVHHIGALHFGHDGALYVSGGDGATEVSNGQNTADYGQFGNACGDPPSPKGTNLTPPTAQGGSLRAQDMLAGYNSDPNSLDGTVVRVPTSNPSQRRIVAWGLRNPFRFTIRPTTNELYIGDPGLTSYEEIDRAPNTGGSSNFGWPCWEGPAQQSLFAAKHLNMCTSLYNAKTDTKPFFDYAESSDVVPGRSDCATASGAVTGMAFYEGSSYPTKGLYFADYGRPCLFLLPSTTTNGVPSKTPQFVATLPSVGVTDVEPGPNGDLLIVDINTGTIYELHYG